MYLESYPEYITHFTKGNILYPTAINIELTTFCNLKCIMCPKTSGISRTPPDRKIDKNLLEKVLIDVLPYISRIDLVGDGEVLLDLDLVEIVLFHAQKHHVLVNASTNGLLLTKKACHLLVKGELHDLNISMDAARKETYQTIRGGDFEKLLSNIRLLNEIKSEYGSQIPYLHFSMVGMKQNIQELPELVELAHTLNVNSVTLQAMGEFEPVKNESIFLRDKKLGSYWFNQASRLGKSLGIRVSLWPSDQFDENLLTDHQVLQSSNTNQIRFKDCDFPWDVPYICTDGTVRPCCAMSPLGDLKQSTFDEIWYGNAYKNLREKMKSPTPPVICQTCPGRGWYRPTQPVSELVIGTHDRQLGLGWFERESSENTDFRWAREKAGFFLKHSDANFIEIELEAASEPGATKDITIEVDNSLKYFFELPPGKREKVFLPIVNHQKNLHYFELSGKPWRPCDHIKSNKDPRYLTVKFFRSRLFQTVGSAKFENGVYFHGAELPKSVSPNSQFEISLYLSIDSLSPLKTNNLYYFLHFTKEGYRFGKSKYALNVLLRSLQNHLFLGQETFFQKDNALFLSNTPSVIQQVSVDILLKEKIKYGTYLVSFGLYQKSGKRICVLDSSSQVFRNGIFLGQVEISDAP